MDMGCDDFDARDDKLQRFSKGTVAPVSEVRIVRWVRSIGSESATNCDAHPFVSAPKSGS
jgi:hypothetical protein